jgi:hypothetical protein
LALQQICVKRMHAAKVLHNQVGSCAIQRPEVQGKRAHFLWRRGA